MTTHDEIEREARQDRYDNPPERDYDEPTMADESMPAVSVEEANEEVRAMIAAQRAEERAEHEPVPLHRDSETVYDTDADMISALIADDHNGGASRCFSMYGATTRDCAPVAAALARIIGDANGEPVTGVSLHYTMGLVVNDHPDVATLIADHGTDADRALIED